jgi:hypothetical protein
MRRQDPHGIRIPHELWLAIGVRADADRRTRTQWAQFILDAACRGALVPIPRTLAEQLDRWAAHEGVSRDELVLGFLDWCIARKESAHRRRTRRKGEP